MLSLQLPRQGFPFAWEKVFASFPALTKQWLWPPCPALRVTLVVTGLCELPHAGASWGPPAPSCQAWLHDGGVREANARLPDIPERAFEGRRVSC